MQSQFKVVADGAALGFGDSPQPPPWTVALKFIWLQYFLDQAVGPGEYFLDQVNISWARWLVLQEISLSIKRDFWIHISRSLATHRLPPSLARKSVRPNVISGGQLSKCGDLLEIEIY